VQLLDKREAVINLKHLSEYAETPTRDDLMIFKSRDCSFLKNLNLSEMGVSDYDLESISDLQLTNLAISKNELKDLHELKNMQSLISLDVSGCPIDKQGLGVIIGLKHLLSLFLCDTSIDDKDLESLADMKSLRYVAVSNCPNVTDRGVKEFESRSPHCQVIDKKSTPGGGFTDVMRVQCSLIADGEYDEADMSLKGLIKRWQAHSPVPYAWVVRAIRYRAHCQANMQRMDQACRLYDQSLALCDKSTPNNPEKPDLQIDYATLLEKLGRLNQATTLRKSADQYWKNHPTDAAESLSYRPNIAWLAKHH
jgi:tetratricopeptide (TPR) repeat protein